MSDLDELVAKLTNQQQPQNPVTDARSLIQMALSSGQGIVDRRRRRGSSLRSPNTPISASAASSHMPPGAAPTDGNDVQRLTQAMAAQRGWSGPEWDALFDLIRRESGWNPNAQNPTSSAAGLFQFLDSTRQNYGITRDSPLQAQIDAGLRYIADRYQSPSRALEHWLAAKPINGRNVGHWY